MEAKRVSLRIYLITGSLLQSFSLSIQHTFQHSGSTSKFMHACTNLAVPWLLDTFRYALHETEVHRMVLVPAMSFIALFRRSACTMRGCVFSESRYQCR